jgi:putative nucleotidyltransferase with HDIG domain
MNAPRANEFLGQIPSLTHDLPCSIELLQKLSAMIYDHSLASAEEIGALIGRDQSFAAKALALANSPFYGLQRKVATVGRAVAVLGVREIRNMIFIIHYKRLATMLQPELLDMNAFLDHNLKVAEKAKVVCEVAGRGEPEELYTAGLLHDIGKVLTALHRPEDWRRIVLGRKSHVRCGPRRRRTGVSTTAPSAPWPWRHGNSPPCSSSRSGSTIVPSAPGRTGRWRSSSRSRTASSQAMSRRERPRSSCSRNSGSISEPSIKP